MGDFFLGRQQQVRGLKPNKPPITERTISESVTPPDASKGPIIAIVDEFSEHAKMVDIDGDKKPDLTHGHFMFELIKAKYPNAQLMAFDLDETTTDTSTPKSLTVSSILRELKQIQHHMANGVQFEAVNFSIGFDRSPSDILEMDDNKIKAVLKEESDTKAQFKDMTSVITELETIAKTTPVYICGGNEGKKRFNFYTLSKGVNVCGAVKPNDPNTIEKYSADNRLVNQKGIGTIQINYLPGQGEMLPGYDLNNDDIVDIPVTDMRLSKGVPTFNPGIGKSYPELCLRHTAQQVHSDDKTLTHIEKMTPAWQEHVKNDLMSDYYGDFVEVDEGNNFIRYGYYEDLDKNIVYNPLRNKQKNVVNLIYGTSCVGPNIIGDKLQKKYGQAK